MKANLFWNTMPQLLFQVVRFAGAIAIARMLAPEDFGLVSVAMIAIYYANNISNFGFGTALVQRRVLGDYHADSVFVLNATVSVLLTVAALVAARPLEGFVGMPGLQGVVVALSPVFLVTSFSIVPVSLLRRAMRFRELALIEFVKGVFQIAVTLVMAFGGMSYWSLVFGMILSEAFFSCMTCVVARWRPRFRFRRSAVSDLLNFSLWSFAVGQIDTFHYHVDKIIVGKYLGAAALGFYDKAFSFAVMPYENVVGRVSSVMFSLFSRLQDSKEGVQEYFAKSVTLIIFVCSPVLLGLCAVAPCFVMVLLGDKWKTMITPMQILCVAFLVASVSSLIRNLNMAIKLHRAQGRIQLICAVASLFALLAFVKFGITRVSFVILASQVLYLVLTASLLVRSSSVKFADFITAAILPLTGSIGMATGVVALSKLLLTEYNVVNLGGLVLTGVALYVAWFFTFRFGAMMPIHQEVMRRLRLVRSGR